MTIIFDFDGTIADSFEFVTAFLERYAAGGRKLTVTELATMRGMTMPQMARRMGSSRWRLPLLFVLGRHAMGRTIYDVPIFVGMGRVIEQLHAEGHELMIVSSNNSRNIRKFLKQHHLYKYFTDLYGGAGFFGKRRAISAVLARNNIHPRDAVYIGDETRDVEAARAAGIRVISVVWGFAQRDTLEAMEPEAVAYETQDIVRILEEL